MNSLNRSPAANRSPSPSPWPDLTLSSWEDTRDTLHL